MEEVAEEVVNILFDECLFSPSARAYTTHILYYKRRALFSIYFAVQTCCWFVCLFIVATAATAATAVIILIRVYASEVVCFVLILLS